MKNKIKNALVEAGKGTVVFGKLLAAWYAFYMVIYYVTYFVLKLTSKED